MTMLACKSDSYYQKEGYSKLIVIDERGLDGCGFLLKTENNEKLEPTNIPENFKKNNYKIWAKFSLIKGGASICMSGPMIKLIDIKKR